jgi:type IX secretion system PorP/SprF family membrane protein
MRRRILFVWCLFGISWKLYSQQNPAFSNYMSSIANYNPAYAGSTGNISANFLYRNQWNALAGAPSTQAVAVHAPIVHQSIGIGGLLMGDQAGPLKTLTASAMYAYRINFKKGILSFGLQGGIKQYKLSTGLLDPKDKGDGSLPVSDANFILPDAGAGIFYQSESWQLSVSAMQLISKRIANPQMVLSPYFYVITSYILNRKGYIHLVPAIFLKTSARQEFQGDFSLYGRSPEATLGLSFRTNHIISFQIALHLNKLLPALQENITFGYAYDHFTSSSSLGNGANEFFLQYNFKINQSIKRVEKQPKSHAPKFF